MAIQEEQEQSQRVFQRLKVPCVPLLGNSLLTPSSIPQVSKLLDELTRTLQEIQRSGYTLTPSLISYVFYPLSTILRRNAPAAIPEQVLEKLLVVLAILSEAWWWDCDLRVWEQLFVFSASVIGGIESKGKGKDRDEETKEAAARCLWALVRGPAASDDPNDSDSRAGRARFRIAELQALVGTRKFIPVLGQTIDSLLNTANSRHTPLQRISLKVLKALISDYLPEYFVPSVLPGIVSSMTKVSLGTSGSKGWANGELVVNALKVFQVITIRSIGDDVCIREGAVRDVSDLEDLAELVSESSQESKSTGVKAEPFATPRTPVWLRATSSQLHIALNSLKPLVSHPTPTALRGLSSVSAAILTSTSMTLPQSQPLLLSFLLSLSNSSFNTVLCHAQDSLAQVLAPPSKARQSCIQAIMQIMRDNLSALPRLIPLYSDAKVEHVAKLVEAICNISAVAVSNGSQKDYGLSSVAEGIAKLLGPTGGIEKWGFTLLSVLEFATPSISVTTRASAAQLMLDHDAASSISVSWPALTMKNISSRDALTALERMFRAMGKAAGDNCLFAVEWFANVGQQGRSSRSVAALWCASRLLEGISDISLDSVVASSTILEKRSKRLTRLARALARNLSEIWDEDSDDSEHTTDSRHEELDHRDENLKLEYRQGMTPVHTLLDARSAPQSIRPSNTPHPILHKVSALQLLAITSGILQTRFLPLLLHALYPILHSIISPHAYLSETGMAALNFVTLSTSFASPANLLYSNFDYALDAVSRRLSRRWLDIEATKVLAVLVRLVGRNIVEKAGDVVEECFDRLDEYHGYDVIVEGLVDVLTEVVKVIGSDEDSVLSRETRPNPLRDSLKDAERLDEFFKWFPHRHESPAETSETEDHGPTPREAWGEAETGVTEEDAAAEERKAQEAPDPNAEPPATPTQALTKQIVSRSLYFLTHGMPIIRARILTLLGSAVPVLPESALLPSVHHAWPFILNRLSDPEPFVVAAAASLIESLATHVGSFMSRRVWDDVWPQFRKVLSQLDAADGKTALAKRGVGAVGTDSAYTTSHRLYRALLRTLTATMDGVHVEDTPAWEVILSCRRFLHAGAHEELQACARNLYRAIGRNNEDAVWLALNATCGSIGGTVAYLREPRWKIEHNVSLILTSMTTAT